MDIPCIGETNVLKDEVVKDVLIVPNIMLNLLLVSKMTK